MILDVMGIPDAAFWWLVALSVFLFLGIQTNS